MERVGAMSRSRSISVSVSVSVLVLASVDACLYFAVFYSGLRTLDCGHAGLRCCATNSNSRLDYPAPQLGPRPRRDQVTASKHGPCWAVLSECWPLGTTSFPMEDRDPSLPDNALPAPGQI